MKLQTQAQINLIPFIDVMLVLLAIVLISASFIAHGQLRVSLPKVEGEPLQAAPVGHRLTLTADGQTLFDDSALDAEALERRLATLPATTPLTLQVDAAAPFERFAQLAERLQRHGLERLTLLTERP